MCLGNRILLTFTFLEDLWYRHHTVTFRMIAKWSPKWKVVYRNMFVMIMLMGYKLPLNGQPVTLTPFRTCYNPIINCLYCFCYILPRITLSGIACVCLWQLRSRKMSLKILRTDIPVQCTHAPHLRGRLARIPTDSCIVSDAQSAINMCPSQIWKPRFPNVKIREKSIELPERTREKCFFCEMCKKCRKLCNGYFAKSTRSS